VYGINTGVTNPADFGMPEIAISGFNSLGGNHGWPLLTTPNSTYQFMDNISYAHGKHNIRFGGEFRRGGTNNQRDRYGKSRIQFSGGGCAFAGSSPLEDFIAGCARRGRIFVGNSVRHVTMISSGAFVQDDWRVSQHLTVNLGMRYDLNRVIHEDNNNLANFIPYDAQGKFSTTAALGIKQVGKGIDAPYHGDHNNFSPRLGLSWDPWGRGKTVIRAGGGVTYEIPHLAVFLGQNGVNNASTAGINVIPTAASTGIPGANGTIAASAVNVSGSSLNWSLAGPVFNTSIDCSATPCDILGVDQNLRTPYVQQLIDLKNAPAGDDPVAHTRRMQAVVDEFMGKVTALLRERKALLDQLHFPLEACVRLLGLAIDRVVQQGMTGAEWEVPDELLVLFPDDVRAYFRPRQATQTPRPATYI